MLLNLGVHAANHKRDALNHATQISKFYRHVRSFHRFFYSMEENKMQTNCNNIITAAIIVTEIVYF